MFFWSSKRYPWARVGPSPWPIMLSLSLVFLFFNLAVGFNEASVDKEGPWWVCFWSMVPLLYSLCFWWRALSKESLAGMHTSQEISNYKLAFALFIWSELFFFVGLFWAFFHSALSPSDVIGCMWPPILGINPISPWGLPLTGLLILVSSGYSINIAHKGVRARQWGTALRAMGLTLTLGGAFTYIQLMEFQEAAFTMQDGIYGSCFYTITGFHGLHVVGGSTFNLYCFYHIFRGSYSPSQMVTLKMACWYWHFVDIVWIIAFVTIYVWGNWSPQTPDQLNPAAY
nr:cytochrome c oxidase subunit 3 [Glottidia pyramidata]